MSYDTTSILHTLISEARRKHHGQLVRPVRASNRDVPLDSEWYTSLYVYHLRGVPLVMLYYNTPDNSTHAVSIEVKPHVAEEFSTIITEARAK